MKGLELIATAAALPRKAVTNAELALLVDTSDEWITTRTGIGQRYFCAESESAATLAAAAAQKAVAAAAAADAGFTAERLGCVVVGTLSGDYATPSLACLVQAALGLPQDIPVLDVNAACSGFLYGLNVARGLLAVQDFARPYALVIGCEQLSRLLDFTDRTTCVLFGDGAGAGVFKASGAPFAAMMGARGDRSILALGPGPEPSRITMDGKAVFRFAVDALPRCMTGVLQSAGKTLDEVDWVVCHQANERIIDHCVKKLGAPPEKFYKNMARYGNTSAASIPLALAEMAETGLLRPGQVVLCVGFGGGLTWAGTLFCYGGGCEDGVSGR